MRKKENEEQKITNPKSGFGYIIKTGKNLIKVR